MSPGLPVAPSLGSLKARASNSGSDQEPAAGPKQHRCGKSQGPQAACGSSYSGRNSPGSSSDGREESRQGGVPMVAGVGGGEEAAPGTQGLLEESSPEPTGSEH